MSTPTKDQRLAWRRERATLTNPIDRIAFDNQRVEGGLLRGLVLLAFEAEDANEDGGTNDVS